MPPPLQGLQRTYFLAPNPNYHHPTGMYGTDTLKFHPRAQTTTTLQPSSFIQHDSTSPEAIRSRAIYDTCLAFSTQHYGPSPSWQKAIEHGNFNIGYDATLDAHLQHRLSYEPFSWDPLCVPEVYDHQNGLLLRLEWSYRSRARDEGEVGLCLSKCGGTRLSHMEYEFEEYVPRIPVLGWKDAPTEFELLKLPMEIIGCVIEQCTPGDGAALSLTCKTLYTFARPLILAHHPESYALSPPNGRRQYRVPEIPHKHPSCIDMRSWREGRAGHGVCKKKSCYHCICTDCPLYKRLVNWMPAKYRFCATQCRKFKLKRKFKNGKCYHGSSPVAPRPRLGFTYKKAKGGFSLNYNNGTWKKYYKERNMTAAMDRWQEERKVCGPYSLRKRPTPTQKRLEHVFQRIRTGVKVEEKDGNKDVD